MCFIFHCSYGTHESHDSLKLISIDSNFIFTIILKVWVKNQFCEAVLAIKFCLLHLKHKYFIDATARELYKGLMVAHI